MMMLKDQLLNLEMIMFGGKGGVGKTSSAASAAIWAAEHGRKTIVISTDPAHSLGDSLGLELEPGDPSPMPNVENLTALEINPTAKMSEFGDISAVNPVGSMEMGDMMENIMPGMEELKHLNSLTPPGIDEALAFGKVLEFIETEHEYDLIIFDTAPTGHTLRFLSLPETLSSWIGKIVKLRLKIGKFFGAIKNFFSKSEEEDENSLELLEKLNESIVKARKDLTNEDKNTFIIVMIPEEMAISETGRLINELVKYEIPSSNIVVNKLYKDPKELCDFCLARRRMQQRNLNKIKKIFGDKLGKNVIEVPLFKEEIREYPQLKEMAQYLID
ncbi:MAG: TRC40/GET3/ArsA family transport-energizing ATPase [Promethearchaeia archaeon]